EPRASLRLAFCVFAVHPFVASHALQVSRSLILCLVRPLRTRPIKQNFMTKRPMLNIILIAIPTIIVAFLIIVAIQPSNYRVARSIVIAAPQDAVFPHMNELKKWEAWNPWGKADPNMKLTYGSPVSGVGANYSWAGNNEVGERSEERRVGKEG